MNERYLCIHGHFYQPPRENPGLEDVELQDSAYPYHDWNERITAECYAPNAASRILDGQGRIEKLVNNYARISFNFGPTLLVWMERQAPQVYQAILEGDRESRRRYSGHGSALAQAYNHVILPLASPRDKRTQVIWGIEDFRYRFGRDPEGMWLPETAVDLETLDVLAEMGISFSILAPSQARRVRPLGSDNWHDVSGERIDPTMAYRIALPSGRSMALFFYDAPISRAVAFEGLLSNGETFASRLLGGFSDHRGRPQLVHIATDGESYGHHHRHGEMALAYALHYIESNQRARLTNYGEFLERHPPTWGVEIFENSSWSCAHGVERWRSDCGCRQGGPAGWNQAWRAPLRQALDWLRDELARLFEEMGRRLFKDPWDARDHYIRVVLDRSPATVARFLREHARGPLERSQWVKALKLLEIQRQAMFMYTSCGWFFADLSGPETIQVLQYADRAVQLAQELTGDRLEERFLERLQRCSSNLAEHRDGRSVYEKFVRPARVDLLKVGAHYAVSSLFERYERSDKIFCYRVEQEDFRTSEVGRARIALGRVRIESEITWESQTVSFGVLHLGDHNIWGGVRIYQGKERFARMLKEVRESFSRADLPETIRRIDAHFGTSTYSLRSLFRDEQRKITGQILETTLGEAGALYRQIHERNAPLARFLRELDFPVPKAFTAATELFINESLRRMAENPQPDSGELRTLLEEARANQVALDSATLEYGLGRTLARMAQRLGTDPMDTELMGRFRALLETVKMAQLQVNLWEVQNACYRAIRSSFSGLRSLAEAGEQGAKRALEDWSWVAEVLGIRMV